MYEASSLGSGQLIKRRASLRLRFVRRWYIYLLDHIAYC